jgi:hypothetical protein
LASTGALAVSPSRASVSMQLAGMADTSTAPAPIPASSEARSSAPVISRPETLTGPRRSRSSSLTRASGGTFSSRSSRPGSSVSAAAAAVAIVSHTRVVAAVRISITNLTSACTPGSSTRWRRSQRTAASNSALDGSSRVQARAARYARSSVLASGSLKLR